MQIAVITGPTYEIAKNRVALANHSRDGIELRLDLFKSFTIEQVASLIDLCEGKVILTLRSRSQGGNFIGSEGKRMRILSQLLPLGPDYIDLEYNTPVEGVLSLLAVNSDVKIITSYHDFDRTPRHFERVYSKMLSEFSYAYKMCFTAHSIADSYKMLRFIQHMSKSNVRFIGLCMGIAGRITRTEGLKAGNYLNYTVLHNRDSCAPGLYKERSLATI